MIKKLYYKLLHAPATKNITLSLIFLGITLVILGMHMGEPSDKHFIETMRDILPDVITKIGVAILGAGVFAVILKTVQFVDIFREHIFEVFYSPEAFKSVKDLRTKWLELTEVILKNTLPMSHSAASEKIRKQFIDKELHYHFEKYKVTYEIEVVENAGKIGLDIKHSINTEIIVSPSHKDPIFEQTITTKENGSCELISLIINDKEYSHDDYLKPRDDAPLKKDFSMKLKELVEKNNTCIKMERVYQLKQDFATEPFIIATNIRYVKGFAVNTKISEGYKVFFRRTGIGTLDEVHSIDKDGNGNQRWVLADPDTLILPGEGYIIIVVKCD